MTFDLTICKKCYWYNKSWCDAEYHKKAEDVYYKCNKHIEAHKGQMSIEDLIQINTENGYKLC